MMKIVKIASVILGLLAITAIFAPDQFVQNANNYIERKTIERQNEQTLSQITEEDFIPKIPRESTFAEPDTTPVPPPTQAYLDVDFICQAPLQTEANWTLHEESCEEAALLMAYLYETNQHRTPQEANQEILDMIKWQKDNLGGHFDLYADDFKNFASQYYNIPPQQILIIKNASLDDIKQEINSGHPVIVPVTGGILKNPYYPYPGYHMLVVTGYTEERIITNDNGTRRGEDFSYENNIFSAAMKDAGGDIIILKLENKA